MEIKIEENAKKVNIKTEKNITAYDLAQKIINDLYKKEVYDNTDIGLLSVIFELKKRKRE